MSVTESDVRSFDEPLAEDRLRFYLRNRTIIDQWAGLAKEVTAAVSEILEGLLPDIEALVPRLGEDVSFGLYGSSSGWPRFALARAAWPRMPEEPMVAITLEWLANKVDPAGQNAPYVGIRIPDVAAIRQPVADRLRFITKQRLDAYAVYSAWWPAHKRLLAKGGAEWWMDVPAWRAEMVEAVATAWVELDPAVQEALADRGA